MSSCIILVIIIQQLLRIVTDNITIVFIVLEDDALCCFDLPSIKKDVHIACFAKTKETYNTFLVIENLMLAICIHVCLKKKIMRYWLFNDEYIL